MKNEDLHWGNYPNEDKAFICEEIIAIAMGKRSDEQKNHFIQWLEDSGKALDKIQPQVIKTAQNP